MAQFITPIPSTGTRYPTITPFTYRDGLTYAKTLDLLVQAMRELIDKVDEHGEELFDLVVDVLNEKIDDINTALSDQETSVDTKLDNLETFVNTEISDMRAYVDGETADLRAYVNTKVDEILNAGVEVQDPLVRQMVEDANSETRTALDTLYPDRTDVENSLTDLETSINTNIQRVDDDVDALETRVTGAETSVTSLETLVNSGRLSETELTALIEDLALETHRNNPENVAVSVENRTVEGLDFVHTTVHKGNKNIPNLFKKGVGMFYGSNENMKPERKTLQEFSAETGATLAITASGWKLSGNPGEITGAQFIDGVMHHPSSDSHWQQSDSFAVTKHGEIKFYSYVDGETVTDMESDEVESSWGFGPIIYRDGAPRQLTHSLWSGFSNTTISGRTIFIEHNNGDVSFMTVQGVTNSSGTNIEKIMQVLDVLDVKNAINMDSGGSTQLVVNEGNAVPSSDTDGRRALPDCLYLTQPTNYSTYGKIPVNYESDFTDADRPSFIVDYGKNIFLYVSAKQKNGDMGSGDLKMFTLPEWAKPTNNLVQQGVGNASNVRKVTVNTSQSVFALNGTTVTNITAIYNYPKAND